MTGVNAVIFEGADSRIVRVALEHIARTPALVIPSSRSVVAPHISIQTNRQLPPPLIAASDGDSSLLSKYRSHLVFAVFSCGKSLIPS
jgi:hypothetical protein